MPRPTIAHRTAGTYKAFTPNKSEHILIPPTPLKHTQSQCCLVTPRSLSQRLMAWIPLSAFVFISFLHKSRFRSECKQRGEWAPCLCHFSVTEFIHWTLPDTEPCRISALSHTQLWPVLTPAWCWTLFNTELCLVKQCYSSKTCIWLTPTDTLTLKP